MKFRQVIVVLIGIFLSSAILPGAGFYIFSQKKTTKVQSKSKNKNSKSQKITDLKTSKEVKKKIEETKKEIKLTEEQIKANEVKVKRELAELGKIEGSIIETQNKIDAYNLRLKELSKKIGNLENNISKNESELELLRGEYLKAIKKMRIARKNKSKMAFLFSSKSFNQANRRLRYLMEFAEWRRKKSNEINGKIADLKNEKESLSKLREEEQVALSIQKSAGQDLENQKEKQEMLVFQLKQNGDALKSHLKKKQTEANELGEMISRMIAEEQKKEEERKSIAEQKRQEELRLQKEKEDADIRKHQEDLQAQREKENDKTKKQVPKSKKPSDEYANARRRSPRNNNKTDQPAKNSKEEIQGALFQDFKGKLPLPVKGKFNIISRFGRQNFPDLPDVEFDNPGIDAEVETGAFATAVFEGIVSGVYLLPGYNTVVIVNHDGYYTVYGNIASASVKVGDSVKVGQDLGSLLSDENNPGHGLIHFEVWKNREKQNPEEWLK